MRCSFQRMPFQKSTITQGSYGLNITTWIFFFKLLNDHFKNHWPSFLPKSSLDIYKLKEAPQLPVCCRFKLRELIQASGTERSRVASFKAWFSSTQRYLCQVKEALSLCDPLTWKPSLSSASVAKEVQTMLKLECFNKTQQSTTKG